MPGERVAERLARLDVLAHGDERRHGRLSERGREHVHEMDRAAIWQERDREWNGAVSRF